MCAVCRVRLIFESLLHSRPPPPAFRLIRFLTMIITRTGQFRYAQLRGREGIGTRLRQL